VATATPRDTPLGEQTHDPPPQIGISPPSVTTAEEPSQQLDLGQVEAARRVQQRLIELGYLFGTADGVWGPRSRKALQDFRIANGIGDNDTWDRPTQERLLAASDAIAADPSDVSFIGGWGVDVAQCRESPLTITASRAEAFGAACEFHSTQRESANVWRLRAQCGNDSERWNANIRFALSGDKLTWSSERGTTTYRRCPS
jgi:peptidoglycan hydrolase-like protein with peptidoglycan-binding domain